MAWVFDVNETRISVNASSYAAAVEAACSFVDRIAFDTPDFQSDDDDLIPEECSEPAPPADGLGSCGHWVVDIVRIGHRNDKSSSCHSSETYCSQASFVSRTPCKHALACEPGIDWDGAGLSVSEAVSIDKDIPLAGAERPRILGI